MKLERKRSVKSPRKGSAEGLHRAQVNGVKKERKSKIEGAQLQKFNFDKGAQEGAFFMERSFVRLFQFCNLMIHKVNEAQYKTTTILNIVGIGRD